LPPTALVALSTVLPMPGRAGGAEASANCGARRLSATV
jgi:hypothetical protein